MPSRVNYGEHQAFEAFVLARSSALLRTSYLLTGDRGHAEDLLQTALERLYRHWHRLDGDPEGWVRTTLANLATDRWRRLSVRVRETGTHDRPETGGDDGDLQAVLHRQDLERLLRRLTPRQRAVLVLRYFEDWTEAETAAALNCSTGTVKSTASRALGRLRNDLPTPASTRSNR